ncbi:MAG: Lrp/AsnC family transcriptional regulator [Pelotomaculum sp.]|uniref:Transcriptional regulator n=1 Tax=Pelotomaculum thermopropionicum (strain DSM 13744 / JCM 10971 / SI) TaxID=370438 RepID=A5CYA7_PELTS|nr:Lrp/AsnC family transcriptional regulator [Pelotomaculum sp.]BAF61031.1 transcriptional regulator [Pelotomaculum thermopropionicum SI]
MKEILELLEGNARLTPGQIATMLGMEEGEVTRIIKEMEEKKVILGYYTLVNWEKAGEEKVSALIEVKISPQREVGFDAVAERIYRFPEVKTVRLMSGAYDLAVMVEGQNLKEVANFVAQKLASLDNVLSTTTHFVLKTYKNQGVIVEDGEEDRRLVVTP